MMVISSRKTKQYQWVILSIVLWLVLLIQANSWSLYFSQEFTSMLKLKPGQRVLDVGGGIGGSAFHMVKVCTTAPGKKIARAAFSILVEIDVGFFFLFIRGRDVNKANNG